MYIFRVLWETHNPKVGKKDGRVLKGVETARKCDCWYASLFPVPFQDLSTLQYVYWSPSSRRERSSGTTSLLTSLLAWSRGDISKSSNRCFRPSVFFTTIHLLYLEQSFGFCFETGPFAWSISNPDKVSFLCGPLNLASVICLLSICWW